MSKCRAANKEALELTFDGALAPIDIGPSSLRTFFQSIRQRRASHHIAWLLPQLLLDVVCGHVANLLPHAARSVAAILVLASTCTALNPTPSTRPALYFPGGGLYYWWQAGVVERLQRSDHDGPVCGASAGALGGDVLQV